MAIYNPERYFTLYPGRSACPQQREYEVEGRCRKTGTTTRRIVHAWNAREARAAFETSYPDETCVRVRPASQ